MVNFRFNTQLIFNHAFKHTCYALGGDLAAKVLSQTEVAKSLTEKKAEMFWTEFIKAGEPFEKALKKDVTNLFNSWKARLMPQVNSGHDIEKAIESTSKRFKEDLKHHIYVWSQKLTKSERKRVFTLLAEGLEKKGYIGTAKRMKGSLGIDFDTLNPNVMNYLSDYSVSLAGEVTETATSMLTNQFLRAQEAGEDMDDIRDRVANSFDGFSQYRSEMIARSETIRISNYANEETYKESGVVESKEWLCAVSERTCDFCSEMNGKIMNLGEAYFEQGSSMTVNEKELPFNYSDVMAPPLHPNCLIDSQTIIYTSKGWSPIGKIKVGDLVLTHKGRFRKVTKTYRVAKQKSNVVKITFNSIRHYFLTLTEEHPVLVNNKWIAAKDIKAGDSLSILSSECPRCGKQIPYYKKYCSQSCISKDVTDRQWSSEEHRKNMSIKAKAQMYREYTDGTRDPYQITKKANEAFKQFCFENGNPFSRPEVREKIKLVTNTPEQRKASSERMKINNPSCIPEVRKRMTESYKKTMLLHPDKHPNRVMSKRGFISSLEKAIMNLLDAMNVKYEHQFPINRFFVDFALPNYQIVIEADGEYWHQDKEKDLERQRIIEDNGWKIIRFSEQEIKNQLSLVGQELNRVICNHKGEYKFISEKVVSTESWNLRKARMLYNLSVEEDESFIAKGVVIHNCRCCLLPVINQEATTQDLEQVVEGEENILWQEMKTTEELASYFKDTWGINFDFSNKKILNTLKVDVGNILGSELNRLINSTSLSSYFEGEAALTNIKFMKSNTFSKAGEYTKTLNKKTITIQPKFVTAIKDYKLNETKNNFLKYFEKEKKFNSSNTLVGTFRHELGHHVYYNGGPRQLISWNEQFWNLYSKEWWTKNISGYAATNASEAFAESFSIYTSPFYKEGMLPEKMEEFFAEILGKK